MAGGREWERAVQTARWSPVSEHPVSRRQRGSWSGRITWVIRRVAGERDSWGQKTHFISS